MLPWGHAAVGYLCYTLGFRVRNRRPPAGPAVVALALGTQVPDLVDKPLAWHLGVLASGRSFAHSMLTLAVVAGLLSLLVRNRAELAVTGALVLGWASHLLADAYPFVLGEATCVNYMAWPLVVCPYDESHSILAHLLAVDLTASVWLELGLTAIAAGIWLRDGAPGWEYLLEKVTPTDN
jgi:membrane-bound metal-dependent hydrolase YbcI (DUF457 family)